MSEHSNTNFSLKYGGVILLNHRIVACCKCVRMWVLWFDGYQKGDWKYDLLCKRLWFANQDVFDENTMYGNCYIYIWDRHGLLVKIRVFHIHSY